LNKEIFKYIVKTPVGKNSELQLTDALSQSLKDSRKVMAYGMMGGRVDVGSWEYLEDEREHYRKMSDDDLIQIRNSRKNIIHKILLNKKGQIK
jgi:UTP-glucose-1-phosphate uridylyltransferase